MPSPRFVSSLSLALDVICWCLTRPPSLLDGRYRSSTPPRTRSGEPRPSVRSRSSTGRGSLAVPSPRGTTSARECSRGSGRVQLVPLVSLSFPIISDPPLSSLISWIFGLVSFPVFSSCSSCFGPAQSFSSLWTPYDYRRIKDALLSFSLPVARLSVHIERGARSASNSRARRTNVESSASTLRPQLRV